MDDEVIGFGVQACPNGRRSFTIDYSFERRRRRLYIGDFPDWSCVAAREEAKRLKREIDRGIDPLAVRDDRFTAPTVAELAERYLAEHVSKLAARSAADVTSIVKTHVLPAWGSRKAADICAADVDALLAKVVRGRVRPRKGKTKQKRRKALAAARPTPVRANGVGEIVRKIYSLAVR